MIQASILIYMIGFIISTIMFIYNFKDELTKSNLKYILYYSLGSWLTLITLLIIFVIDVDNFDDTNLT